MTIISPKIECVPEHYSKIAVQVYLEPQIIVNLFNHILINNSINNHIQNFIDF